MGNKRTKKSISLEGFVFLAIFLGIFGGMGMKMGGVNMLNTLMNTGYQLLLETVFYIWQSRFLPEPFQDCSQNSVSFRW